jgi:PKD repeat protein
LSLTVSGNDANLYLNNVLIGSGTIDLTKFKDILVNGVLLGNANTGMVGIVGRIHNFRIYLSALDSEGRQQNLNKDIERFGEDSGSGSGSGSASGSASASGSGSGSVSGSASGSGSSSGSGSVSGSGSGSGGGLPPIAEFNGNPISGSSPLAVQFIDLSQNVPTMWYWQFGDGGYSNDQDTIHVYSNPGIYTVTLTVTNDYGFDMETKVEYIEVL